MIPNGTKWSRLALAVALGLSCVAFSNSCRNKAAESLKALRTRADHGDAKAQLNLGIMYEDGKGVKQDYAEAVRWYRKAADQGLAEAQFNLGLMYDHGQGVARDHAEAYKLLSLAASRASGDDQKKCADARELVAKKMLPQQIVEAQTPGAGVEAEGEPVKA